MIQVWRSHYLSLCSFVISTCWLVPLTLNIWSKQNLSRRKTLIISPYHQFSVEKVTSKQLNHLSPTLHGTVAYSTPSNIFCLIGSHFRRANLKIKIDSKLFYFCWRNIQNVWTYSDKTSYYLEFLSIGRKLAVNRSSYAWIFEKFNS